jgi:hypothetical protein
LLLGTASVIAAAAVLYYPYSRAASTQRHLTLAHEHVTRLEPMLGQDPRFVGVHVIETAREGGVIQVSGTVASLETLRQLRQLVEASNPPVGVLWAVDIKGQPASTHPSM